MHRFKIFAVYGPYGRPDMAYYSFTQKIDAGRLLVFSITKEMKRDFTYIDDTIEAMVKMSLIPVSQTNDTSDAKAPYRVLNIGNNNPVTLAIYFSN